MEFYQRMAETCGPTLTNLHLRDTEARGANGIIVAFASRCPNLQNLWFGCPQGREHIPSALSDDTFVTLVNSCPRLRHLSLLCYLDVGDQAFAQLPNLRQLTVLDIPVMLRQISPEALLHVGERLTSLESLSMTARPTVQFLKTMVQDREALRSMRIYGLDRVMMDDEKFKELHMDKFVTEKYGLPAITWHK